MPPSYLHQLERHAATRPDALALVEHDVRGPGRSISWARFHHAVASLTARFVRKLPRGATVLLIAGNRIEYLIAFHAGLLADATIFPLSPQLGPAEWREAARRSGATACIAEATAMHAVADVVSTWLAIDAIPLDCDSNDIASLRQHHRGTGSILLQSSGTTGLPKIVRRSLAALEAVGDNCVRAVGVSADDRMLAAIPICHSYGIDHAVMAAALAGCTVELHARFDAAAARDAITSGRIRVFPGVPFIFEAIAQASTSPVVLAQHLQAFSAGSALPPSVCRMFHMQFGVPLGQLYGSTEFGSVTFNDPYAEPSDLQSVGTPMKGVEIRIVDRDQPRIDSPLPPGCEGQIAVAAPSMFSEYLGQSESPLVDGFFLSGDLGRLDEHGRLTITGRIKLLIDVGGHKVNPLEVEAVLCEHPAVREAAVIPMPVSDTMQRLKAVIVWKAAGDVESLRQFVRDRLAPFKVPRVFEERDSLPRSATGKLLRNQVK